VNAPGGRPSRRAVLGGGLTVAAGAALSRRLGLVERAYAAEPTACAPLSDIEHVVIVMQENRSFDHYFGTYPAVRGFSDPQALPGVFAQAGYAPGIGADPTGHLLPYHLDTRDVHTYAECINDITHDWGPQHACYDNGRMDRWVSTHVAVDGAGIGPLTMGYYARPDLAFYYALADAFTLCDAYHCSVLGPTDPNRVYWMSATLDPAGAAGGPVLSTLTTNRASQYGKFTWQTMPEVLTEAGVSWRVYQDTTGAALFNPLPYFKAYNDPASPLFGNAFGAYTFPGTFQADVAAGRLPAVSWLIPDITASEHPAAPIALGEEFVSQILATLLANPAVWEKTAMFVMYDENGGFFDHVPPPVAPAGTAGEYLSVDPLPADAAGIRGPIGLGYRVPMLVISPYARGGLICSEVFDHTSQLLFLERRFGAPVPNLSAWRRETVGDLTAAFDFAGPSQPAVGPLPDPALDAPIIVAECVPAGVTGTEDAGPTYPVPANSMPHQQPGTARRPSGCPAPPPGRLRSAGAGAGAGAGPGSGSGSGPAGGTAGKAELAVTGGSGPALPALLASVAAAALWRLRQRRPR
jgi:phospholipase C